MLYTCYKILFRNNQHCVHRSDFWNHLHNAHNRGTLHTHRVYSGYQSVRGTTFSYLKFYKLFQKSDIIKIPYNVCYKNGN